MKIIVRKYLILIICIVYLLAVNANLIIWLEYNYNYDFIVKFLCVQKDEPENLCHGSCHLKKNLEQTDEQNKPAEKPGRELNTFSVSSHLENKNTLSNILNNQPSEFNCDNIFNLLSSDIQPDSPPPKLL